MSTLALAPPAWRRWLVLPVLSMAISMVGIDVSIVSVANATIGRDLHASLGALQWVTNAYLLALSTLLLNAGRLGDRIGRKRVFVTGVGAFAISSAGCALATTTPELIGCRAVQGAAGALLMPTSMAILQATFSGRDLDVAVGAWGSASLGSIVIGPILGGFLVEHVSWQAVFLINLPIGALTVLGAIWFAAESRDTSARGGFDIPGTVLGAAGLFLLVFALIKAQSHGWGSLYTVSMLGAAVLVLLAFLVWQRSAAAPLLPLELFRSRAVTAATALGLITYFCLYGVLFFWTLYLQRVLGDSPVTSGIQLLPLTLGFLVTVPLAGWVGLRFGLRTSMSVGLFGLLAGALLMTQVQVADGYDGVWPGFLVLGAAFAFASLSGMETMLSNAPVRLAGIAGAVVSASTQLGGVLGIAVLGSVLASHATRTLAHDLTAHGVTPSLAAKLASQAATSSTQTLVHLPGGQAQLVGRIASGAFLDGLHLAMLIVAGLALAGAPLAHVVKRGNTAPAAKHLV
ncbi:MAG: MFS transporter [Solirubrobacteraceae bacterium]